MVDPFLEASHITRTKHAHQATANGLYILLERSYAYYQESLEPECQAEMFDDWSEKIKRFHSSISGTQFSNLSSLSLASSGLYARQTLLCMLTACPS